MRKAPDIKADEAKKAAERRRRFDGWLAGATAEQQAAWEARQRKAETVPDEQLPPPLRGGNLEVF